MSTLSLAAAVVCLAVVGGETGVRMWMGHRPPARKTPVFDWTGGAGGLDKTGGKAFAQALAVYQADRGRSVELPPEGGVFLQVQFMEWDEIEEGANMAVAGHAPEVCNKANGFTFEGRSSPRVWDAGIPLAFDSTVFRSPSGQAVYVFKTAWMAAIGNVSLEGIGEDRLARLSASFRRRAGSGRMLMAGVFGAESADQAWEVFRRRVLADVVWKREG